MSLLPVLQVSLYAIIFVINSIRLTNAGYNKSTGGDASINSSRAATSRRISAATPPKNRMNVIKDDVRNITRPNIVLIVVDDVGWNDVGWHNNDVMTPHLSRLANEGVVLNSSYVTPLCSPSRAAILTGIYPFRLGLQHGVLKRTKPHGLPLNVTILPQQLKALGYSTHIVGKWHLGFCNWSYTPTYRGFDSFFGFYTGQQDYFNHKTTGTERGYDLRYNTKVFKSFTPRYSTTMYGKHAADVIMSHNRRQPLFLYLAFQAAHTPLQVPSKYESFYRQVKNPKRRKFLAMVTALDEAVGDVMIALRRRNIINNTLIVFISDNGASPYGAGNNWPLRGGKSTTWEGGVRVPCFVWGRMLNKTGYTHHGLMHAVDWVPTLLSAAGKQDTYYAANEGFELDIKRTAEDNNVASLNAMSHRDDVIDGRIQWDMIRYGQPSNRTEFIYDLNSVTGQAAIRSGRYKLIEGSPGHYSDWFPPPIQRAGDIWILKQSNRRREQDRHLNQTMLFDIAADPIEANDLSSRYPEVIDKLRQKLVFYRKLERAPFNPRKVRAGLPKYWNGVWSPGWC